MSSLSLIENNEKISKEGLRFSWKDSLPIQHLLDAISSIIAEEYTAIAKKNPAVFSEIALPRLGGARNDGRRYFWCAFLEKNSFRNTPIH